MKRIFTILLILVATLHISFGTEEIQKIVLEREGFERKSHFLDIFRHPKAHAIIEEKYSSEIIQFISKPDILEFAASIREEKNLSKIEHVMASIDSLPIQNEGSPFVEKELDVLSLFLRTLEGDSFIFIRFPDESIYEFEISYRLEHERN